MTREPSITQARRLHVERLESRLLLSRTWNLAADFAADFVGGLPQHNPNGAWSYLGTDSRTTSLVATSGAPSPGPNTFGVGAGWADTSGVPSYARGGVFGFPTETMAGHGPNKIIWQAPPDAVLGGVELSGLFTQATFESARQMRLQIYKNDSYEPFSVVDANFTDQDAIVPIPTARVAIAPGDTLAILVDGSGPHGNGTSTFAAWNVTIEEIALGGDYNRNAMADAADYTVWRDTFGSFSQLGADGNKNGIIDPVDYELWRLNFGAVFESGELTPEYRPAAIVVEPSGVTLPDGTLLDTSSSETHGLQEAFDFSAENGWDVFVLPGTYTLHEHLDLRELQLRTFRFEDVTLNFSPLVTDFAIRFDSTMQVDWYWNGGAINAPGATHAVLFQPHTPHPKDGPIYGTVGVVDSRFEFNANILAGGHHVTMDTTRAVINDVIFSFKNVPPSSIHFVGGGFTETNIFTSPRTDDAIPFDLFSTAGRVTVLPPRGQYGIAGPHSFATVFRPDGTLLDVSGSRTAGLQEAFDLAALYNLDLLVFGRGVRNANPNTSFGTYGLTTTLTVGDLDERTYRVYGATLFNPQQGGTVLVMGGALSSDFEITGEVVGYGSDNVVIIRPQATAIRGSSIRIGSPVARPEVDVNVLIDPSFQTIENSRFYFNEVNQGQFGVRIDNPSASTYFQNNFLRATHVHETNVVAVQLGQHETNAGHIRSNTFELRTAAATYPSLIAVQVWGDYNSIDLVAVGTNQSFGAKLEPGSNDNTLFYGRLSAASPIVDHGTANLSVPHGSAAGTVSAESSAERWPRKGRLANASVSMNHSADGELLLSIAKASRVRNAETNGVATDLAFGAEDVRDVERPSYSTGKLEVILEARYKALTEDGGD